MTNLKLLILLLTLSIGASFRASNANAFELTALGGITAGTVSQTSQNIPVSWNSQVGYSFGLLASTNFMVLPFDFESGLMYTTYSAQLQTTQEVRKTHWIQIPLIARITLADVIGLGFGGYLGIAQGSVDSTTIANTTAQYLRATRSQQNRRRTRL